jgi:GST-like protein
MASFPWVQTHKAQEISLDDFPNLRRWYEALKSRPGLRRGMDLGRAAINRRPQDDARASEILFGIKKD